MNLRLSWQKNIRDGIRIYRKTIKKPGTIAGLIVVLGVFFTNPPAETRLPEILGIKDTQTAIYSSLSARKAPVVVPYRSNVNDPEISAQGVAVLDLNSHTFLYTKNADAHFIPASLTKIATALVALKTCAPDTVIQVNRLQTEGSQMGLRMGENITVENLLLGTFLNSGNDAAQALADGCFSGDAEELNKEARAWHLTHTHFSGVTGLEEEDHYISPKDMALFSERAYENPLIRDIIRQKEIEVVSADLTQWHHLKNINPLLGTVDGVVGMKTGWTENAGECMVTVYQNGPVQIIAVVMKSNDRSEDTKKIIDWVQSSYQW